MKKLAFLFIVLLAAPLGAFAGNMGDDFHDHYIPGVSNLKAYNRD